MSKFSATLASVAAPPRGARQGFRGPNYPRHPSQVDDKSALDFFRAVSLCGLYSKRMHHYFVLHVSLSCSVCHASVRPPDASPELQLWFQNDTNSLGKNGYYVNTINKSLRKMLILFHWVKHPRTTRMFSNCNEQACGFTGIFCHQMANLCMKTSKHWSNKIQNGHEPFDGTRLGDCSMTLDGRKCDKLGGNLKT